MPHTDAPDQAPAGAGGLRRARWALTALVCAALAVAVLLGDACFPSVAPAATPPATTGGTREPLSSRLLERAAPLPPTLPRISMAPIEASPAAAVLDEVRAISTASGGSFALVVLDVDRTPVVELEADRPVPTASWVKVLVVGRLLELGSTGAVELTPEDLELMERALTVSDDEAMNTLWVRHDGARLVTEVAAALGLTNTTAPEVAGQWGLTTTTARDAATYLAHLRATPGDGARTVLSWLRATAPTAADGFDQRFGLLAGGTGSSEAAVKQGWMCCPGDRRTLVSAGVLADGRVVTVFADYPDSTPWAAAVGALDAVAVAVAAASS